MSSHDSPPPPQENPGRKPGGAVIGALIDRAYDGSLIPFGVGAAVTGLVAYAFMLIADRAFRSEYETAEPVVATRSAWMIPPSLISRDSAKSRTACSSVFSSNDSTCSRRSRI